MKNNQITKYFLVKEETKTDSDGLTSVIESKKLIRSFTKGRKTDPAKCKNLDKSSLPLRHQSQNAKAILKDLKSGVISQFVKGNCIACNKFTMVHIYGENCHECYSLFKSQTRDIEGLEQRRLFIQEKNFNEKKAHRANNITQAEAARDPYGDLDYLSDSEIDEYLDNYLN